MSPPSVVARKTLGHYKEPIGLPKMQYRKLKGKKRQYHLIPLVHSFHSGRGMDFLPAGHVTFQQ
jgi:hypothetical protein